MKSNDYRIDNRTLGEFKKNIKDSHVAEAEIAIRICIKIHHATGKWPELFPTGSDFTGTFIQSSNNVDHTPDFSINGVLTEVTRSDVQCKRVFHEKTTKVDKCINNDWDLVFVNGFKTFKQPQFLLLGPQELEEYTIRSKTKYSNILHPSANGTLNKEAYRYDIYWFDEDNLWNVLPPLIKSLPKEYVEILEKVRSNETS
jgi:hypothetical protein